MGRIQVPDGAMQALACNLCPTLPNLNEVCQVVTSNPLIVAHLEQIWADSGFLNALFPDVEEGGKMFRPEGLLHNIMFVCGSTWVWERWLWGGQHCVSR